MYLSLKGSLGHTPITDRVGENLLQIAEGASAAYSLRNLGSDSPAVVRVRRESDNNERDFTAQDISTSVLTNWVNEQITPPLDLRELTATGRDGPIIEAAAAYSLRNLSDSYTGSVVDVRRSSDGSTQPFTATEVADGTLTDWVNTENLLYTSNFSTSDRDGWKSSNCSIASNIDKDSDGAGQPPSDNWLRISANDRISIRDNDPLMDDIRPLGGGTYKIDVDYYAPVSVSNHRAVAFTSSGAIQSAALNFSAGSGTKTYILVLTDAQVSGLSDLRIGSTQNYATGTLLYLKNIRVRKTDANGFVSKWYDQSTTSGVPNANHAVNSDPAEQPSIVINGELYSNGIRIETNQHLVSPSNLNFSLNNISSFVYGAASGGQGVGGLTSTASISVFSNPYRYSSSQGYRYGGEAASLQPNNSAIQLFTLIGSPTIAEGFSNGTSYRTSTVSTTSYTNKSIQIGSSSGNLITGDVHEVIYYNTDQTDNRTALEANIGEVYGIAGIPAYEDTVNGFVETWYDQSGNGNDATQQVSGSQPKIVDGGVLVSGGLEFDGVDDTLVVTGNPVITANYEGTYSAFSVQTVVTNVSGYIAGNASPSNGSSLLAKASSDFALTNKNGGNFDSISRAAGKNILSACYNNGDASLLVNGGGSMVDAGSYNFNAGTSDFRIGSRSPSNVFLEGKIEEIIIYNSDQTANRPAIEANINNQYDIY